MRGGEPQGTQIGSPLPSVTLGAAILVVHQLTDLGIGHCPNDHLWRFIIRERHSVGIGRDRPSGRLGEGICQLSAIDTQWDLLRVGETVFRILGNENTSGTPVKGAPDVRCG